MGKAIAIVNDKGGVGKSTTAINLAAGLALRSKQVRPEKKFAVLTIDLDPSTVTTLSSIHSKNYEVPDSTRSIVELFKIKPPAEPTREYVGELLKAFVRSSEFHDNLWFVPTHRAELRELIKHNLAQMPNREIRLARIIKLFRRVFDYIVIDTPPFGEEITNNALLSSDCVLVPVNGSNLATRGLIEAVGRIKVLENEFDRRIPIMGIVATDINDDSTARAVLSELETQYPGGHPAGRAPFGRYRRGSQPAYGYLHLPPGARRQPVVFRKFPLSARIRPAGRKSGRRVGGRGDPKCRLSAK